jgi:hypothetical protein
MVVSSRTPEGEPAVCPVCGDVVRIEPSLYFYDAPCPSCGLLLWFVRIGEHQVLLRPGDEARARGLLKSLSDVTGKSELDLRRDPSLLDELDPDSMDFVELVLELE